MLSLLFLAGLAGCLDAGPREDPAECDERVLCEPEEHFRDHHCERNDVRPRVYAPDTDGPDTDPDPWVVGDFWEYRLVVDGEDLGKSKLAYYGDQDGGAHYMVGTPTREEALHHAVHSTNPVIGRVHRTLYSPHEAGDHADMFFFPLCQGSAWRDTFFGVRFDFTANRQTLTLPDGSTDPLGFVIRGTASDGSTVEHTYSPRVKWFTRIDLDRADGSTVEMTLTDTGGGYEGPAHFLRGQQDEVVDLGAFPRSQDIVVPRGDGGEGPYDRVGISIDARRATGTGRAEVQALDPDGTVVACVGFSGSSPGGSSPCPDQPVLTEARYRPGDWTVRIQYGVLSDARLDGEVRIVSIYDRSGRA